MFCGPVGPCCADTCAFRTHLPACLGLLPAGGAAAAGRRCAPQHHLRQPRHWLPTGPGVSAALPRRPRRGQPHRAGSGEGRAQRLAGRGSAAQGRPALPGCAAGGCTLLRHLLAEPPAFHPALPQLAPNPTTFPNPPLQHHLPAPPACPACLPTLPRLPALQIDMVKGIQAASRKLCHKQMSWFRDEEMFRGVGGWVGGAGGRAGGRVDAVWVGCGAPNSASGCSGRGTHCSGQQLQVGAHTCPCCQAGCSHAWAAQPAAGGWTRLGGRRRCLPRCWSAGSSRSTRAATAATTAGSRGCCRRRRKVACTGAAMLLNACRRPPACPSARPPACPSFLPPGMPRTRPPAPPPHLGAAMHPLSPPLQQG